MKFSIGAIWSDSATSIRKNPFVMLPPLLMALAPLLLGLLLSGLGMRLDYYGTGSRNRFDNDDIVAIIVYAVALLILSFIFYAWTFQLAAAVVRDGAVGLGRALKLFGGKTLKVALSQVVVVLIFIGLMVIFMLITNLMLTDEFSLILIIVFAVCLFILIGSFMSLVPVACAYDDCGPLRALSIGTMRVRTAYWSTVAFLLVTALATGGASFLAGLVTAELSKGPGAALVAAIAVETVVSVLATAFFALALAHIYAVLKPEPASDVVDAPEASASTG